MDEESESMEEYEKYLQEAKFMMKNNKYYYKDNNNNNNLLCLNSNDINNINIGSSVATAGFNNGINSLNNNISNSKDDNILDNKLIYFSIKDLQSKEIPEEIDNQLVSSPNNNIIKGSLLSMKDNKFISKSSSLKLNELNKNNDRNIIKELKEEISKIKFQIEINHKKYINYEKTIETLKKIKMENDLRCKKLHSDFIKKEKDLNKKYQEMEYKSYDQERDKQIEFDKRLNILKTKYENLKENNYNLKQKLSILKKENCELEQISDMKENELFEELLIKDNEINQLQENYNNLEQNYSIIEEENKNNIRELMQQINEEKKILNSYNLHLKKSGKNNIVKKHKRNISSIYENKYNIEDNDNNNNNNNNNESKLSKSINSYDLFKIMELKERIKSLEKEIVVLNNQICEKIGENDELADKIFELRKILEKDEIKKNKKNKNFYEKEKRDNKTIADLQLMINEYENKLNEIKQIYDLKIKEQNDEKIKTAYNYEQKIKELLKRIKKINYEIFS